MNPSSQIKGSMNLLWVIGNSKVLSQSFQFLITRLIQANSTLKQRCHCFNTISSNVAVLECIAIMDPLIWFSSILTKLSAELRVYFTSKLPILRLSSAKVEHFCSCMTRQIRWPSIDIFRYGIPFCRVENRRRVGGTHTWCRCATMPISIDVVVCWWPLNGWWQPRTVSTQKTRHRLGLCPLLSSEHVILMTSRMKMGTLRWGEQRWDKHAWLKFLLIIILIFIIRNGILLTLSHGLIRLCRSWNHYSEATILPIGSYFVRILNPILRTVLYVS